MTKINNNTKPKNADFRIHFSTNIVEIRYRYQLTSLRFTIIGLSMLMIYLGLTETFNFQSEYLENILNYSKEQSNNIIKITFLTVGMLGTLLGSFFWEFISTRKALYIPLGIINVFLGIILTKNSNRNNTGKGNTFIKYNS